MINIFKGNRKSFLKEGKIGKYLKYAIGEICLVMIGILLAIQVNNWNQKTQLKKEEIATLKSMQDAIAINLEELTFALNAQIYRNQSLQAILLAEVEKKSLSSLDSLITANVQNHTFDPSTGVYNALINSGKIELISNDSLKSRISKLFDWVSDYQETEDEVTIYTQAHLETYFIENYNIDPLVISGYRKRTREEELNDRSFYSNTVSSQRVKNIYILLLNKMNDVITKGEKLKEEYMGLVSDLQREIQEMGK